MPAQRRRRGAALSIGATFAAIGAAATPVAAASRSGSASGSGSGANPPGAVAFDSGLQCSTTGGFFALAENCIQIWGTGLHVDKIQVSHDEHTTPRAGYTDCVTPAPSGHMTINAGVAGSVVSQEPETDLRCIPGSQSQTEYSIYPNKNMAAGTYCGMWWQADAHGGWSQSPAGHWACATVHS